MGENLSIILLPLDFVGVVGAGLLEELEDGDADVDGGVAASIVFSWPLAAFLAAAEVQASGLVFSKAHIGMPMVPLLGSTLAGNPAVGCAPHGPGEIPFSDEHVLQ